MIPALILMFSPAASLPAAMQAVVYGIPFSYPVLASQALYTQHYLPVALGLVYQLAFAGAVLGLAARVFTTEKVLTAKLDLGKKKAPPQD
jgi:ABC-2 type transport system permease protein